VQVTDIEYSANYRYTVQCELQIYSRLRVTDMQYNANYSTSYRYAAQCELQIYSTVQVTDIEYSAGYRYAVQC
jgi:hypothetical protein